MFLMLCLPSLVFYSLMKLICELVADITKSSWKMVIAKLWKNMNCRLYQQTRIFAIWRYKPGSKTYLSILNYRHKHFVLMNKFLRKFIVHICLYERKKQLLYYPYISWIISTSASSPNRANHQCFIQLTTCFSKTSKNLRKHNIDFLNHNLLK